MLVTNFFVFFFRSRERFYERIRWRAAWESSTCFVDRLGSTETLTFSVECFGLPLLIVKPEFDFGIWFGKCM